MIDAFYPNVGILYLIMALPFILHMIAVVKGITIFPKWMVITNPVVIYCIHFLISDSLPESAVVSAVSMGILNEGMLIWLLCSLVYLFTKIRTGEVDFESDRNSIANETTIIRGD